MTATVLGVPRESAPGERRVALMPATVAELCAGGILVLVESAAGAHAMATDADYVRAGALIVGAAELYDRAHVIVCVRPPDRQAPLRVDQILLGTLAPHLRPRQVQQWAQRGVTAISLDLLPRTLSRVQEMDVLTSQANIAGYKAALVAANDYPGYFPMLMTAAGVVRPATVLVLGAGVAGLAAIATAHRLGALVTGYDVRPEARGEIASLGARFLDLGPEIDATSGGGYARALTATEQAAQQHALDERLAEFDVVITTAGTPGQRPPRLVTLAALARMRPGSVVVDTLAGPLGGNVDGSEPDTTVLVPPGVRLAGAGNLASSMPVAASAAYSRNIAAALRLLLPDGVPRIDLDDEVQASIVLCHRGESLGAASAGHSEQGQVA